MVTIKFVTPVRGRTGIASLFPEASFLHLAGARQQVAASSAPTPRVAPPDTTDEQARRSLPPGRFW